MIVELRARMTEYELGVFGLRESVQEAERLRNTLSSRDDEVYTYIHMYIYLYMCISMKTCLYLYV